MNLEELLASLALTNNGYLFAPTVVELQCARDNPDAVDLRFGRISRKGAVSVPCFWSYPPALHRAHSVTFDGPDWEGAILAQQETSGLYD